MNIEELMEEADIYVMCSTLNQIVNYIPYKIMKNRKDKNFLVYNITTNYENEGMDQNFKRNDNQFWDNNIKNVLSKEDVEIKDIVIRDFYDEFKKDINKMFRIEDEDLSKVLDKHKDDKVVWNLTGGQRKILFAVQKFIIENERLNDKIMYMEGNEQKIYLWYLKENKFEIEELENKYCLQAEDLDLEKGFNLTGFQIKNATSGNCIKEHSIYSEMKWKELFKLYKENEEFRNNIRLLNKENIDKAYLRQKFNQILKAGVSKNKVEKFIEEIIEKVESKIDFDVKDSSGYEDFNAEKLLAIIKNYKKIKAQIEDLGLSGFKAYLKKEVEKELNLKQIKLDENDYKGDNPFGYILENMLMSILVDCIDENYKENFLDLRHSVNVEKFKWRSEVSKKVRSRNYTDLAEFDIALMHESGQIVIFECKSGTMSSEVAKARNYTAYVISGVYGKPVIITPLLKDEIKELESGMYDNAIEEAVGAAMRANLDIWGIDEIEEKLKALFLLEKDKGDY